MHSPTTRCRRLRRRSLVGLVGLLAMSCHAAAPMGVYSAPTSSGSSTVLNLAGHLGGRSFSNAEDYGGEEDQLALGLAADWRKEDQVLGYETGLLFSSGVEETFGSDVESDHTELFVGLRATRGLPLLERSTVGLVNGYVGAGVSLVSTSVGFESFTGGSNASDDDVSAGAYGHCGFYFYLFSPEPDGSLPEAVMNLGVDLRYLFLTDMELLGASTDADYSQYTVFFGVSV